jgi:hypothetical protein
MYCEAMLFTQSRQGTRLLLGWIRFFKITSKIESKLVFGTVASILENTRKCTLREQTVCAQWGHMVVKVYEGGGLSNPQYWNR